MGLMDALRNLFGAGANRRGGTRRERGRVSRLPDHAGAGASGVRVEHRGRDQQDFPDGVKEHKFIRVDTHSSKDDAVAFSITKAQQIIDEQGDRIFRNS